MALNVDCLLLVLKHCLAEDVCKVSRTNRDINALLNRHLRMLPQLHSTLIITVNGCEMRIRCYPVGSRQSMLMPHQLSRRITGMELKHFLEHWRYVAVDEVAVYSDRDWHNQQLMEQCFKELETLNFKKLTLVHVWRGLFRVSVSGPGPGELLRFVEDADGGFFYSPTHPSGRNVDFSLLVQLLLNSNNVIMITSKGCSRAGFAPFTEQLLQEASKRKEKLASFYFFFTFAFEVADSSFLKHMDEMFRRFAVVKKTKKNGWLHEEAMLKDSKTKLHFLHDQFRTYVKIYCDNEGMLPEIDRVTSLAFRLR